MSSNKSKDAVIGFNVDDKYVFPTCSKLQPYAGEGLGYTHSNVSRNQVYGNEAVLPIVGDDGEFSVDLKVGFIYLFNRTVGIFTEGEYRVMPCYWCTGLAFHFKLK